MNMTMIDLIVPDEERNYVLQELSDNVLGERDIAIFVPIGIRIFTQIPDLIMEDLGELLFLEEYEIGRISQYKKVN